MSVLDHFIQIAPIFSQCVMEDCHFTVADTEKFLVSIPGKTFKLGIEAGDTLKDGAITKIALEKKERIVAQGNKQLYGVAHIAVCIPIIENGEVVGCISIAYAIDKADKINETSEKLSVMVDQISSSSQSIAAAAQELASKNEKLTVISDQIRDKMIGVSEISLFVTEIASKTNLLGLNAEIESAHAGDYGRGFSVVSKEIRRLAHDSQQSSHKIKEEIQHIQKLIHDILNEIEISASFTESQAAAAEELAASMEDLNAMARALHDLSKF